MVGAPRRKCAKSCAPPFGPSREKPSLSASACALCLEISGSKGTSPNGVVNRQSRPNSDASQILMILVDTNVLSAAMRVAGEPAVERWLDAQPPEAIWTTTITIFEIRFGLALLAPGRRRPALCRLRSHHRRDPRRPRAAIRPDCCGNRGRNRCPAAASATSRSPVSSPRAKQPSRPAIPVTSQIWASPWLILGRPSVQTQSGESAGDGDKMKTSNNSVTPAKAGAQGQKWVPAFPTDDNEAILASESGEFRCISTCVTN